MISGGHYTSDSQGNWYYIKDEKALTGMQNIDNVTVSLWMPMVSKSKETPVKLTEQHITLRKIAGQLTRNAFASDKNGNWYYLGQDGESTL